MYALDARQWRMTRRELCISWVWRMRRRTEGLHEASMLYPPLASSSGVSPQRFQFWPLHWGTTSIYLIFDVDPINLGVRLVDSYPRPQRRYPRSLLPLPFRPHPPPSPPLQAHHVLDSQSHGAGRLSPDNIAPPHCQPRDSLCLPTPYPQHYPSPRRYTQWPAPTTRLIPPPHARPLAPEQAERHGRSRELLPAHRDDARDVRRAGAVLPATVSSPLHTIPT